MGILWILFEDMYCMGIMGTIWLYVQYNEYGHTISRGI